MHALIESSDIFVREDVRNFLELFVRPMGWRLTFKLTFDSIAVTVCSQLYVDFSVDFDFALLKMRVLLARASSFGCVAPSVAYDAKPFPRNHGNARLTALALLKADFDIDHNSEKIPTATSKFWQAQERYQHRRMRKLSTSRNLPASRIEELKFPVSGFPYL